jgi:hypothetical protein
VDQQFAEQSGSDQSRRGLKEGSWYQLTGDRERLAQ